MFAALSVLPAPIFATCKAATISATAPAPCVQVKSLHPNHVWQLDASHAFSTLHTQEFDTATACQQAARVFAEKFETFKDIDARAICVKKS
ncbi:hypothetical protein FD733_04785 [Pantoea sp. Eser]|nr:hypothetical protein [Pantoea sp. Eser]